MTSLTLRIALVAALALAPLATSAVAADDTKAMAQMSDPEMVAAADGLVGNMKESLKASFAILEESIADGDVARTTAVNQSITAMKGLLALSEQNLVAMQQASAEGDRERVEREFVKISIAASKVEEFYARARSAGGVQMDIEETDVERTVTKEASLPTVVDMTTSFIDVGHDTVPEAPIHASPYF